MGFSPSLIAFPKRSGEPRHRRNVYQAFPTKGDETQGRGDKYLSRRQASPKKGGLQELTSHSQFTLFISAVMSPLLFLMEKKSRNTDKRKGFFPFSTFLRAWKDRYPL